MHLLCIPSQVPPRDLMLQTLKISLQRIVLIGTLRCLQTVTQCFHLVFLHQGGKHAFYWMAKANVFLKLSASDKQKWEGHASDHNENIKHLPQMEHISKSELEHWANNPP